VAKIEGKDNISSEDKLGNAFTALLVDIDEEVAEEQHSDSYFTLVENLLTKPAIAHIGSPHAEVLIEELNNQALMHQLMAQVPIDSTKPKEVEETTTFTTGSTSRYDSHHFYGVVINTRASKYSTARCGQFQALQCTNDSITLNEATKGQVKV
jgi:hypothetical protein